MNNQSGLSTGIAVAVAAVVLIGGVVVWTFVSRSSMDDSATTSSAKPSSQAEPQNTSEESTPDAKTYSTDILPFTFRYGNEWRTVETPGEQGLPGFVVVKKSGNDIDLGCEQSQAGTIEEFKSDDIIYRDYSSNKKDGSVDGTYAITYTSKYEGPERRLTRFIVDKELCSVSVKESQYKINDVKNQYDQIISSVKLK